MAIDNVSNNSPAMYINYQDGSYSVGQQNQQTQQIEVNQKGLTEAQMNDILAPYGLQVQGGVVTAVDGFEVTSGSPSANVVMSYGDQPWLTDVEGPGMPGEDLANQVTDWSSDNVTAFMALMILSQLESSNMRTARELRQAFYERKISEQMDSINASKEKIENEKTSALVSMIVSCAACAVSMYMCTTSFSGAAAGMSDAMNKTWTAIDKNCGWAKQADDAEIDGKMHDKKAEEYGATSDDFKADQEAAADNFKQALRLIVEMAERRSQELNNLLR